MAVIFLTYYTFDLFFLSPSLDQHCKVALFSEAERAHDILISSVKSAKHTIYMELFRLTDPSFISLLQKKQAEGVKVSLFVDKKCAKSSSIRKLKSLGASIQIDKKSGLMHRKIIILDEEISWIGSFNMTRGGFQLQKNALLYIKDADTAAFFKNSNEIFFHQILEETNLSIWKLPPFKHAKKSIIESIKGAQKNIKALLFVLSHPLFIEELIEAKKRGVQVEVIINRSHSNNSSQQFILRMISEGILVHIYQGAQDLHHKLVCIDTNTFFLGSCNWTKSAFSKNREILMKVKTKNKKLTRILTKCWERCLINAPIIAKTTQMLEH